jgi:UreE urease accessory protein, N-terminal domain
MTLRANSFVRAQYLLEKPWEIVVMDSAARHLRRKLITLQHGDQVLVDLEKTTKFEDRDCLVLEDADWFKSSRPMRNCLKLWAVMRLISRNSHGILATDTLKRKLNPIGFSSGATM